MLSTVHAFKFPPSIAAVLHRPRSVKMRPCSVYRTPLLRPRWSIVRFVVGDFDDADFGRTPRGFFGLLLWGLRRGSLQVDVSVKVY
jgi:hypothetical protein